MTESSQTAEQTDTGLVLSDEKQVTLYQQSQAGRPKVWTIEVVPASTDVAGVTPAIRIHHGLQGGKMTTTEIPIKAGKNQGKANETSAYQQAMLQAQSKINKQVQSGYVSDITQIKDSSTLGSGDKEPMLAEKYDPTGQQKGSRTLDKMGIEGQLIGYQRKKDGLRGGMKIKQGGLRIVSRKGLLYPARLTKLEEALRQTPGGAAAFALSLAEPDKEIHLDGELYTREISFNALNGLLKALPEKLKPGQQDILDRVVYHCYDIVSPLGYEEREKMLDAYCDGVLIEKMETEYVIATNDTLNALREKYEAEGEEGGILRILGKPYEFRRTWNLVKHVLVYEEEFELVDILDSAFPGRASKFVLRAPEGATDSKGIPKDTFEAGIGNQTNAEAYEMFANKLTYIGQIATVKFRGFSEYGIPRFGKLKGFRSHLDLDIAEQD